MAKKIVNGVEYPVKRDLDGERFIRVPIENVQLGMHLDAGRFLELQPGTYQGQPNPLTWDVRLMDGLSYFESRGANVRVWIER